MNNYENIPSESLFIKVIASLALVLLGICTFLFIRIFPKVESIRYDLHNIYLEVEP